MLRAIMLVSGLLLVRQPPFMSRGAARFSQPLAQSGFCTARGALIGLRECCSFAWQCTPHRQWQQLQGWGREVPLAVQQQHYHHFSTRTKRHRAALPAVSGFLSDSSSSTDSLRCILPELPEDLADRFGDTLLCFGATAVSSEPKWYVVGKDSVQLTADFEAGSDVAAAVAATADAVGMAAPPRYRLETVSQEQWIQTISDEYQPICISPGEVGSRGLWVVPDWAEGPDPDSYNVLLKPGVAFGAGDHPTTALCLRWLHRNREAFEGAAVLDYGAGSGVLAVAALKMGAAHALAIDCEAQATELCSATAELNGLASWLEVCLCSDDVAEVPSALLESSAGSPRAFGLALANILQGPLLELAPRLARHVSPGGWAALSGVLEGSQAAAVVRAYAAAGFENIEVETQEGWALITCRKVAKNT